ncbi:MAG: endonuclease [Euryarchaeota archaeon]|nr:endonuclease [Euryarchaeota archaeon]
MAGAILTQNTAWTNVERSISNLRAERALTPSAIAKSDVRRLKHLIRPSGFYNQKAPRLQGLARFLIDAGGVPSLKKRPTDDLRADLLSLDGVGPETADSILLYALRKDTFVVDAYTRRIFGRLGLEIGDHYEEVRGNFKAAVGADVRTSSEYHALLVVHAKRHCRAKPLCDSCPLARSCAYYATHRNAIPRAAPIR